jgi:hypothetical protein
MKNHPINYRKVYSIKCCASCLFGKRDGQTHICTKAECGQYEDEYGHIITVYRKTDWNYICDNYHGNKNVCPDCGRVGKDRIKSCYLFDGDENMD